MQRKACNVKKRQDAVGGFINDSILLVVVVASLIIATISGILQFVLPYASQIFSWVTAISVIIFVASLGIIVVLAAFGY